VIASDLAPLGPLFIAKSVHREEAQPASRVGPQHLCIVLFSIWRVAIIFSQLF